MKNFKDWLFQSVLLDINEMAYSNFRKPASLAGKKDINNLPDWFWGWALKKLEDYEKEVVFPVYHDNGSRMTRDELINLAKSKISGTSISKPVNTTPIPSSAPKLASRRWTLAKAKKNIGTIKIEDYVVLTKSSSDDWTVLNKEGEKYEIKQSEVANYVQSIKNPDGKSIQSTDPEKLFSIISVSTQQKELTPDTKKKSGIIPLERMSEEQKKVDEQFAKILKHKDGKQSHIVINADPGSGKTTMLNHLAWKYGKGSGQKWLYLVFNTKNKVEAEQKFPNFVDVRTTNAFLGDDVLGSPENISKIYKTKRIVQAIEKDEDDNQKLEKIRFIIDSEEFNRKMKNEYKVVPKNKIDEDDFENTYVAKSVTTILRNIPYLFKKSCLDLTNLAKAYAVDPRKENALNSIRKILNKHDIDTDLLEIKEKISKYRGNFGNDVAYELSEILGYNFMSKDYTNEILDACYWLLKQSLPYASKQQHEYRGKQYNLGELRDFSDDAWFAVAHADELTWPKYDVVLADEVQDFNEARKVMLNKLHEAGAKHIIAVGDTKQSLYRFIGADSKAMDSLSKMLGDLSEDKNVTHTLSLNFRSRPEVLELVEKETGVKLNQGKQFDDSSDKGQATNGEIEYDSAFETISKEKEEGKLKETAFIARTNQPLTHAALSLLKKGVPFVIVGKDIGRDLMKHVNQTIKRQFRTGNRKIDLSQYSLEDLERALPEHLEYETKQHYGKSTKSEYLRNLKETTEALSASIDNFKSSENNKGTSTVKDFYIWLSEKLGGYDIESNERDYDMYQKKKEEENPVVLTTSHKSKGLEFLRVFILRYDQFPHPKAEKARRGKEEDMVQEENAKFVALTRAQDELHILDVKSQPGVHSNKYD